MNKPWDGAVHPFSERTLGFNTLGEQELLQAAHVNLAGAGGDGAVVAEVLARLGITVDVVGDPDEYSVENASRQLFATEDTVGVNKATAAAERITSIQKLRDGAETPEVRVIEQGVTLGNVEEYVSGVKLVVDETDISVPEIGIAINRAARARNVPVFMVMNVGAGAVATSFHPDGMSFEDWYNQKRDKPFWLPQAAFDKWNEFTAQPLYPWVTHWPKRTDYGMIRAVASGDPRTPPPGIVGGVMAAGMLTAHQVTAHLAGRSQDVVWAPHTFVADPDDKKMDVVTRTYPHYVATLLRSYGRTALGINPSTEYGNLWRNEIRYQ